MRKLTLCFTLLLSSATQLWAPIHGAIRDTLQTCTSNCGTHVCSSNSSIHSVRGESTAIVLQLVATGTITAKVMNSTDNGTTWTDVSSATCADGTCATAKFAVVNPVGLYCWNIDPCTSCTYTASYEMSRLRLW